VDSEPELWFPDASGLRARDTNLKQGSKEEPVEHAEDIVHEIKAVGSTSLSFYDSLLKRGVAPEIARSVLPQSMYTEFIETGSLAAYARLCQLRLDPTAQKEIQLYAEAVSELLKDKFPVSWAALMADI
jgi:thymidylate synthase (FAD)